MTLLNALESCDMLLIDGLHCFDFTLDDGGLMVECMDGRQLRRWQFSAEQVGAARAEGEDWLLGGAQGEHRLLCMSAVRAPEDDDHEDEAEDDLPAPVER